MYDEKVKAVAISRLKRQISIEEIAAELDIPLMLVKEWAENIQGRDLIALEANIHAAAQFAGQDIIDNEDPDKERKLKNKLEDCAMEIAQETSKAISYGDPIFSKSLQICTESITKLYQTFVVKEKDVNALNSPDSKQITLFESLLRD